MTHSPNKKDSDKKKPPAWKSVLIILGIMFGVFGIVGLFAFLIDYYINKPILIDKYKDILNSKNLHSMYYKKVLPSINQMMVYVNRERVGKDHIRFPELMMFLDDFESDRCFHCEDLPNDYHEALAIWQNSKYRLTHSLY